MSTQKRDLRLLVFATCSLVAIMSSNVSADYAAAVLADSPLGYWRFNEPDGDVAVNIGTAGDELNGEYIDAPRVPGPDVVDGRQIIGLGDGNLAISVGDDDPSYVAVDASPMNDVETELGFTFEGWVNAGPRDFDRIGLWGQNDVPEFGFIGPNRIQLWTPAGASVNWDFTEDEIEDDTWFHLAATSNIDATMLYINGEFVMEGPGSGNEFFGFSDFKFNIGGGGVYDPTGNQFTGLIDEVAIWTDQALDEDTILRHYNAAFEPVVGGDPYALLETLTDPQERLDHIHNVIGTWVGDSNKDGEFSSSDFVTVFTAAKYETGQAATWVEGDWNGDKVFNSSDFVTAFIDGGYELGPFMPQVVPEPSGLVILLPTIFIVGSLRRKRQ